MVRSFAAIFNVSMDYLAGMEKQRGIPTTGLTESQIEIMRNLSDILCKLNDGDSHHPTSEQFEIIGKIVAELLK